MSEKPLDQQETLLLAERLLKVSKKLEFITYPEWWRKPHWWMLKTSKVLDFIRVRKRRALSSLRDALVGELSVRYDGIMRELFDCAGGGSPFEEHFRGVWIELQGKAVTSRRPGLFSACLWEIQRRRNATVEDLKPKFMLRQFVDELPDGEPRGALRLLAYSYQMNWPEQSQEAPRMVRRGYELLHERVKARAESLEALTGGVLNARMLGSLRSPEQYDQWLFHECQRLAV
jgi:hypothetical protein